MTVVCRVDAMCGRDRYCVMLWQIVVVCFHVVPVPQPTPIPHPVLNQEGPTCMYVIWWFVCIKRNALIPW